MQLFMQGSIQYKVSAPLSSLELLIYKLHIVHIVRFLPILFSAKIELVNYAIHKDNVKCSRINQCKQVSQSVYDHIPNNLKTANFIVPINKPTGIEHLPQVGHTYRRRSNPHMNEPLASTRADQGLLHI